MKLIDKDALVAEIEKRQRMLDLDSPLGRGGMVELQVLKDKLDTLEVKEATLAIIPKFKVGDIIRHKEQGFICKIIAIDTEYRLSECNGAHLLFDSQDSYELVDESSAWSEEDEAMINSILTCIEHCKIEDIESQYNGNHYVKPKRYESMSDWLKSLKGKILNY